MKNTLSVNNLSTRNRCCGLPASKAFLIETAWSQWKPGWWQIVLPTQALLWRSDLPLGFCYSQAPGTHSLPVQHVLPNRFPLHSIPSWPMKQFLHGLGRRKGNSAGCSLCGYFSLDSNSTDVDGMPIMGRPWQHVFHASFPYPWSQLECRWWMRSQQRPSFKGLPQGLGMH